MTPDERRLAICRENIRYHEELTRRYQLEAAELVTRIENDREREEQSNNTPKW